jgi:hypothetical protein
LKHAALALAHDVLWSPAQDSNGLVGGGPGGEVEMRVIVVALVWGIASMGCEKDPAPSDRTKALQPASPTPATGSATNPSSNTIEVDPNVIRDSDLKAKGNMAEDDDEGVAPSDQSGAGDPASAGHAEEGEEIDDE